MSSKTIKRRHFVASTAVATMIPYCFTARADKPEAKNDRLRVGCVGVGGRGLGVAKEAAALGDIVAVCDVDLNNAEKAREALGGKAAIHQDYRKLLDRTDIDIVTNGTPDHWHTKINVDACRSGRDVYTEKPLTLTIDEGKMLRRVVGETKRIVQVGAQQRSSAPFRTVCELVRNGRIGKLQQVVVMLPFWSTKGGPFATQPVPKSLDWDLWQGQAPQHEFSPARLHFNFRWWSEYAGGIATDWGQHHMDIAHWGMDVEQTGPSEVEGRSFFPNRGQAGCYNNPDRFVVRLKYPRDVEVLYLVVRDEKYLKSMAAGDISEQQDAELFAGVPDEIKREQRNGIMFIGDRGRLFVNRGGAHGKAYDELKENPLPADAARLYVSQNHMANFFDCVKSRKPPVAPVDVEHRTITACHLSNIAMRLGRKIKWDPVKEEIVGDAEAAASMYVKREQRKPYAIEG